MLVDIYLSVNYKRRIVPDGKRNTALEVAYLNLFRIVIRRIVQRIIYLQRVLLVLHEHGKHITLILSVF